MIDARIRRSSTGRYTHELVEKLQKIDLKNRYTILVEADDPWEMTSPNFTTATAPYAQFSFNPLEQINFARQLYRLKADTVHFTMTQFPLLFFHRRIVVTTHDLGMLKTHRPKKTHPIVFWLKKIMYRFLMWQSHRKANQIIVPSDWVKQDLSSHHPFAANKITRTYESGASQQNVTAKKPKNIQKKFILYQGTPFPHKNVKKLVDAFNILHQSNPDLHLHFNGKIEQYYEELQRYIAKQPSRSNIHVNGFVPDPESKWMFQHCLAFVHPTKDEGFGLPGLEAMEQGAPVVCSDIPVLREVYGEAPVYFDPDSETDIADKVSSVINDEKLREAMRKKGHAQTKKFTWDQMAKETLAVYNKTMASES